MYSIVSLLLCAVLVRLFTWQVLSAEKLQGMAQQQTFSTSSILPKRGRIYFSDGSPFVLNQKAFVVFAEPDKLELSAKTLNLLSETLSIDEATLAAKLTNKELKWALLKDKVLPMEAQKLKNEGLKGIGFIDDEKRFYPESSMAAHLLGFVGKNVKGEDQGYFGIEGYYDALLRGRKGERTREEDAKGIPILLGESEEIPVQDGRDLELTLDRSIQFITESKLKEGMAKYGAKGATAIVMDPSNGAILAMASYPSYDPAEYEKFPTEYYKNSAISGSYEPGSTYKVLVMAAALNEGVVKADTQFDEKEPLEIGGYTIRTWNNKYHGMITSAQILEYSSNVGMVFVGQKLGRDKQLDYIQRLGFGANTDVDLQEESSPELRAKNKWYEIDYATASFGQGIAVTPLQMVRAVASIANGGVLVLPHLVNSTLLANGKAITYESSSEKRVFDKDTTSIVTEMMIKAVDNGETKYLKDAKFRIAGKTGTAQVPIAGHYDSDKTIASFVGFAPADAPRFVMLVTVNEPTSSPWGSETAAPIFFNIAKELYYYWGISPS